MSPLTVLTYSGHPSCPNHQFTRNLQTGLGPEDISGAILSLVFLQKEMKEL